MVGLNSWESGLAIFLLLYRELILEGNFFHYKNIFIN